MKIVYESFLNKDALQLQSKNILENFNEIHFHDLITELLFYLSEVKSIREGVNVNDEQVFIGHLMRLFEDKSNTDLFLTNVTFKKGNHALDKLKNIFTGPMLKALFTNIGDNYIYDAKGFFKIVIIPDEKDKYLYDHFVGNDNAISDILGTKLAFNLKHHTILSINVLLKSIKAISTEFDRLFSWNNGLPIFKVAVDFFLFNKQIEKKPSFKSIEFSESSEYLQKFYSDYVFKQQDWTQHWNSIKRYFEMYELLVKNNYFSLSFPYFLPDKFPFSIKIINQLISVSNLIAELSSNSIEFFKILAKLFDQNTPQNELKLLVLSYITDVQYLATAAKGESLLLSDSFWSALVNILKTNMEFNNLTGEYQIKKIATKHLKINRRYEKKGNSVELNAKQNLKSQKEFWFLVATVVVLSTASLFVGYRFWKNVNFSKKNQSQNEKFRTETS